MLLLLLCLAMSAATIKLFRPPICVSSANLNVPTPEFCCIFNGCCSDAGERRASPSDDSVELFDRLYVIVRNGGAGSLYHLKPGFASKNAALYYFRVKN